MTPPPSRATLVPPLASVQERSSPCALFADPGPLNGGARMSKTVFDRLNVPRLYNCVLDRVDATVSDGLPPRHACTYAPGAIGRYCWSGFQNTQGVFGHNAVRKRRFRPPRLVCPPGAQKTGRTLHDGPPGCAFSLATPTDRARSLLQPIPEWIYRNSGPICGAFLVLPALVTLLLIIRANSSALQAGISKRGSHPFGRTSVVALWSSPSSISPTRRARKPPTSH